MIKSGLNIIPLLFLASILLCGCPYSSPYQLDDLPNIYTEDILLGKWAALVKKNNTGIAEPVQMILSKKNYTEYSIAFTGSIKELQPFRVVNNDSVFGTAFMSTINSLQFLNIKIKGRTYIAELKYENETLSLMPLAESFTSKMVLNNTSLRTCVEVHYKTRTRPTYDEDFCLKNMVKVN